MGFSLQLTTVRYLGTFLANPLDVPWPVVDHLARQLEIADSIDAVVPRDRLRAAVAEIGDLVPAADTDPDAEMHAALATRIVTVSGFLRLMTEVIEFGATTEAAPVLAAMRTLPRLLDGRRRKPTVEDVDVALLHGSWRRLVLGAPPRPDGTIDKNAYVFCVLTQFHRQLRRRDIYAEASARWRDPRAQVLAGDAWASAKETTLSALGLSEDPGGLLAAHVDLLDASYREVAGRLAANSAVSVDADGRLHVEALQALPEPPSLVDLRRRVAAMLPLVDLPELILEVMGWVPEFPAAFTAVSGGTSRLADLHVSIAACLAAHAMNIGFHPVVHPGVPALEASRLSHVNQTYLRAETYALANPPLLAAQGGIPLAQAWGGGLARA